MKFDLIKPCAECPFARKCAEGWLGERRAEQIAVGITENDYSSFTCHKTDRPFRFGQPETTEKTQHCGGAILFLENCERPNILMRLAFSAGDLKKEDLTEENRAAVFASVEEFVEHHSK